MNKLSTEKRAQIIKALCESNSVRAVGRMKGHSKGAMVCTGAHKTALMGNPDMSKVSTSYVERQNLSVRMGMRRMTRLTNGISKKAQNHAHAFAIHMIHYNFCRSHQTLTKAARGIRRRQRWRAA